MMRPDQTPAPSPSVVATKLADGQAVLLDIDTGNYINLNTTAAVIWDGIEAGKGRSEIVAQLIETFDVDEAHAAASVDRFLGQLAEAGLVDSSHDRS